jgi:hypothetical protein
MDRRRTAAEAGWAVVMLPRDLRRAVHRAVVADGELRAWRCAAAALSVCVVGLLVVLVLAWPRANAYGALLQENLALKSRLESIDRKMSEVDRILLRLRLYDAQLESLGAPTGPSGPVPGIGPDASPHAGTPDAEFGTDDLSNVPLDMGLERDDLRPAEAWASGIDARAETFLHVFEETEPDLNGVVEELEALEALERALPSFWPAGGFLTSRYGWRRNPFGFRWSHHSGIDLAGTPGDPIYAAAPGTVVHADWSGGYGKAVEIDHGFGITTIYAHCSQLLVSAGDLVQSGDRIATIGTTGRSTGPHLHFEVRLDGNAVDPLDYLGSPATPDTPWHDATGD